MQLSIIRYFEFSVVNRFVGQLCYRKYRNKYRVKVSYKILAYRLCYRLVVKRVYKLLLKFFVYKNDK